MRHEIRVKDLLFGDECPGDMDQFAGAGAQSDFNGFTVGDQAVIKGFDGRIESSGRQGGHIEGGAQASMTGMTDGRSVENRRAGLERERD